MEETLLRSSPALEGDLTWHRCARRLLASHGKVGPGTLALPALYKKHSVLKEDEFLMVLFSIMSVESGFDRRAHNEGGNAYGLLQVTPVAMKDAAVECRIPVLKDMTALFDSATAVRYGTCYLRHALLETAGDITGAVVMYNGGYRQLERYRQGEYLTAETAQYLVKVFSALEYCRAP